MMDKLGAHQGKGSKQAKSKKKAIKVVYISNPMKVKTSASEFRALVQELTGRHSDTGKLSDTLDGHHQTVTDQQQPIKVTDDYVPHHQPDQVEQQQPYYYDHYSPAAATAGRHYNSSSLFQQPSFDDDVFTPQMPDNFAGFMPSSCLLAHEYPPLR